jgi:hypothetical protein
MKPVKNFVFAALLVFSIALNTIAGDIDQPGIVAPPPPPARMTTTTDEITPDTIYTQQTTAETSDYLFLDALAALLSVY